MKYATRLRVDMVRKDTAIHNDWFSRVNGYPPSVLHEYFIRYRSICYHGVIKVHKTDAGLFRVLLSDGTIIDTHELKMMYKLMRGIVKQEIEYIDEIMEV